MNLRTALSLCFLAALAPSALGCSGDASTSTSSETDQGVTAAAASKTAKLIVDCQANADDEAEIESLELVRKSGKITAQLTVSGAGDFIETYSYRVTESDSAAAAGAPATRTFTGANFKLTVAKGGSTMKAKGPKSAQMYPSENIDATLDCTVSE
jgi:hypothetical protein